MHMHELRHAHYCITHYYMCYYTNTPTICKKTFMRTHTHTHTLTHIQMHKTLTHTHTCTSIVLHANSYTNRDAQLRLYIYLVLRVKSISHKSHIYVHDAHLAIKQYTCIYTFVYLYTLI